MGVHDIEVQGLRVPVLGFGTWQLTGRACHDAVAHALAVGYRHIDTARMYRNEQEVGRAIAAATVPRDQVWLTSKLWTNELRADTVRSATDDSLAKLGTDYLDLLLIHWPNPAVPLDETLHTMQELRKAGKLRAVGVSNFPAPLLKDALRIGPILTDQVEYHPYRLQDAVLEVCRQEDLFLTAYSPLARGALFRDPVITGIAGDHGVHPAQVAIAWALAQDRVVAIPKATAPERIESNLAAAELSLSEDEVARIRALGRETDEG